MTNFFSGEHRVTILGLGYRLLRHTKVLDYFQGSRISYQRHYNIRGGIHGRKKAMFYACIPLFFYMGINLSQMPAAAALLRLRLRLKIPVAVRGTVFTSKDVAATQIQLLVDGFID